MAAHNPLAGRAAKFSSKSSLYDRSASDNAHQPAFAFGGVGQASADILARQSRKIGEDFCLSHAGCEIRQHIAYRDARAADARLAEADFGVDNDAVTVIHRGRRWGCRPPQARAAVTPASRPCAALRARGRDPRAVATALGIALHVKGIRETRFRTLQRLLSLVDPAELAKCSCQKTIDDHLRWISAEYLPRRLDRGFVFATVIQSARGDRVVQR